MEQLLGSLHQKGRKIFSAYMHICIQNIHDSGKREESWVQPLRVYIRRAVFLPAETATSEVVVVFSLRFSTTTRTPSLLQLNPEVVVLL